MLIEYNHSFENAVMELLPSDALHTIQQYEKNPAWQLFLWKQEEKLVGLIGIETNDPCFRVLHISVSPSFRGKGIGHAMVEKIQQLTEPMAMCSTMGTRNFLSDCWKKSLPFH